MIRRVGDLAESSKPAEKLFVSILLTYIANGNAITSKTWREADRLWRRVVKDMTDLNHTYPENCAMYVLTAITTAGTDAAGVVHQYYAPQP